MNAATARRSGEQALALRRNTASEDVHKG